MSVPARRLLLPVLALGAWGAAGCISLEPRLPVAQPDIPADWPAMQYPPSEPAAAAAAPVEVADIGWREFFSDAMLVQLIERALAHNRDLRVAVLNVERARALYRIQRAEQFPSVGGTAALSRTGGDANARAVDAYSVSAGAAFELDLFGRVRNLSASALRLYFARDEARRAAHLSLVAEVATAYLVLAADRELLRIAEATLSNYEAAHRLTVQRHDLGAVSGLDLAQARTQLESARGDVARLTGQVAQDANALALLIGTPLDTALTAPELNGTVSTVAIPAGLPSEVLLRRPDVLSAEQTLHAANANVGAARAAYFPSIRLTGSIDTVSAELSGLFRSGSYGWSFLPTISVPIFEAGRLQANVAAAEVDRDIALAQYERAIQSGFREVADALALTRTLAERLSALQALVAAAGDAHRLSEARYAAGRDSFLVLLDAQRTLYTAQQNLVAARLTEQANRVTLYKVLGGGWR